MRSAVAIALLALAPAGIAEAHIHMLQPMSRQTDSLGDPQKTGPCGLAGRTTNRVSTYAPGATITVMWAETVNHTGWYRIAFQPTGDTFQVPPAGASGGSNYPDDATGTMDTAGAMILKDHITDGMLQTDITLPNMTCDTCTLQFIQVMTGAPPYDPGDLYFNCADIVLAANAPDAGTGATTPDAGIDEEEPGGPRSGRETGGCSTGGNGAGAFAALAVLGLAGWRRRRR